MYNVILKLIEGHGKPGMVTLKMNNYNQLALELNICSSGRYSYINCEFIFDGMRFLAGGPTRNRLIYLTKNGRYNSKCKKVDIIF